jgi:hypothetical protein
MATVHQDGQIPGVIRPNSQQLNLSKLDLSILQPVPAADIFIFGTRSKLKTSNLYKNGKDNINSK